MAPTWADLKREAQAAVSKVRDDPEGRYDLRAQFYERYGFEDDFLGLEKYGFGSSELDFMRWEINRGVLDPHSGSPWWRAVNEAFLLSGEWARLAHQEGMKEKGAPLTVGVWLRYFRRPSAEAWYRAHNTNIVMGYLHCREVAFKENCHEQVFMNIVLYRVLFAQAMVEDASYAFGPLGDIMANPQLPAVKVMVGNRDFYPAHYPLSAQDILRVRHAERSLGGLAADMLDDLFIGPHLIRLYLEAAAWNGCPDLARLLRKGQPIYPQMALLPCRDSAQSLWQQTRSIIRIFKQGLRGR